MGANGWRQETGDGKKFKGRTVKGGRGELLQPTGCIFLCPPSPSPPLFSVILPSPSSRYARHPSKEKQKDVWKSGAQASQSTKKLFTWESEKQGNQSKNKFALVERQTGKSIDTKVLPAERLTGT